jgi:hypothetical protein
VVRDAAGEIRQGPQAPHEYDEIEQISAAEVVSANQRLYVNREDGFIGLNWRQHEFVQECTILDSVLCIMADGSLKVARVGDKVFMGRDILHCAVWPKDGDTAFYTMVYQDKARAGRPSPRNSRSAADPRQALPAREVRGLEGGLPRGEPDREGHAEDAARLARRPQPRPGARVRLRPVPFFGSFK